MAEARDQLQKLTECSICVKTFTDPRMLPCIHTFCLECLKQTGKAEKKKYGETMPCPLCRKLFVIPTVGMHGLQSNFFMQHLMDVTTTIQEGQNAVTDCDICKALYEGDELKTKEATMMCLECGDNFCDMCARTHKLHKLSKTHNIVKIGSETEDDIRKMQPTRSCAVHNQQPLNFYCADCKKIICVSCFVENHASHKCQDVTSVEKEFRQTIEMNASKISNFAEEMLSIGRKAEQRATEVLLRFAGTEEKIRQKNVELKQMIDSHTNSLLDQLSLAKQKHMKDSAIDKEEIERMHAIFKSAETYCTELSSKGSASDICDCVDEMVTRANELEKDHKKFIFRPYQKSEVFFKATYLGRLLSNSGNNIVGQIQEGKLQQGHSNTIGSNYFSAVIQCLYKTLPLVAELSSRFNSEEPLNEACVALLNAYKDSPQQIEAFSDIYEHLYESSPTFRNFRQQDSHDNFHQFLNEIGSEESDDSSWFNDDPENVLTPVDKVFGGHFITVFACLKCNYPNFICEFLVDITLPIPISANHHLQIDSGLRSRGPMPMLFEADPISTAGKRESHGHAYYYGKDKNSTQVYMKALNEEQNNPTDGGQPLTITECLRLYTLTEHVPEGHRCTFCQHEPEAAAAAANAQTTPSVIKRTLIYDPPAVLVLHIKRFENTATGCTKRSQKVAYEEYLDLGPYCSSDCQRIYPEDKNVWYSLYGVVVHSGSAESGHYTSYVKTSESDDSDPYAEETYPQYLLETYLDTDEVSSQKLEEWCNPSESKNFKVEYYPIPVSDGRWIFTDDDNTRRATLHEALNQEAFMLFYERVPCDQLLACP